MQMVDNSKSTTENNIKTVKGGNECSTVKSVVCAWTSIWPRGIPCPISTFALLTFSSFARGVAQRVLEPIRGSNAARRHTTTTFPVSPPSPRFFSIHMTPMLFPTIIFFLYFIVAHEQVYCLGAYSDSPYAIRGIITACLQHVLPIGLSVLELEEMNKAVRNYWIK